MNSGIIMKHMVHSKSLEKKVIENWKVVKKTRKIKPKRFVIVQLYKNVDDLFNFYQFLNQGGKSKKENKKEDEKKTKSGSKSETGHNKEKNNDSHYNHESKYHKEKKSKKHHKNNT